MRSITCVAVFISLTIAWAPGVEAGSKGCPPGLAKKSVPCVPPGQASKSGERQHDYPYKRGDIIRDYVVIRDPWRYGLDPRGTYYNSEGYVLRVDEQTREVLDLIGAVAAILD